MAVKFLMQHTVGTLYVKDEIAGFDGPTEADLIERKIAKAVKTKATAASADTGADDGDDADATADGTDDGGAASGDKA